MRKKIAIGVFFLLILSAVAALLLYRQINRAEAELGALLQREGVQFSAVKADFLPKPALHLHDLRFHYAKERSVFFKKIQAQFDGLALFAGDLKIADLEFAEGVVSDSDWRVVKIGLKPTALYTDDIDDLIGFFATKTMAEEASDKWSFDSISADVRNSAGDRFALTANGRIAADGFGGNLTLSAQLVKPAYNQNKTFALEMSEFRFGKRPAQAEYRFVADSVSINHTGLGAVRAEIHAPSAQDNGYRIRLHSSACGNCATHLTWRKTDKQNRVQFRTVGFPLQSLLKILKLPVFAEGEGDVGAEVLFDRLIPQQGEFTLNVAGGKLRGLNILQMVAQYLPINYDQDNPLDTRFEQFSAVYRWNRQRLLVEEMALRSKELRISGTGEVETDNMRCDIRLNIGVNHPKYQDLNLPMRFFDNCYSPQYKIDVNKGFRNQLKNYLKDRLN